MVIHFRGQGLSRRKTLLHCKDIILAVANKWTQINYWNFVLLYLYQLDLV